MTRQQATFEIGIYTLADIGDNPITGEIPTAAQRLKEIMAAAKLADEAGLDCFGVGEHHRHDYAISSPAVVLSAIAQVTKRLKLMSTTTVLNTIDPVRLFEDFATLDLLSGGRAELIVGRGAFIESFRLFGFDMERYDELFREHLELLLELNKQETITWEGEFRSALDHAEISPRPQQKQLPVWVGVGGSVESAARAGRMGARLALAILGGDPKYFQPFVKKYHREATAAGIPHEEQKIAVTGHMFLAESDELARRQFYPYYRNYWGYVNRQRGMSAEITPSQYHHMTGPDTALFVGSPELIIEKILQQHELFGHSRLLAQLDIGGLPYKYVARNIEWLATRVAPVIRRELNK